MEPIEDKEGNKLYGFSQVSLDELNIHINENNKKMDYLSLWLKRAFILGLIGTILGMILVGYLGYEVFHDRVLENIINALIN